MKNCQKYSKVELVRKFEEFIGGVSGSDGNTLVRVLKKTGKIKTEVYMPGETIYKAGDDSDRLFIIEVGSISLLMGWET